METKNVERVELKVRVMPDVKEAWEMMCERKNIIQQQAGDTLIVWILSQADLVQSMVLGQIDVTDSLIKFVIERQRHRPVTKQERIDAGLRALEREIELKRRREQEEKKNKSA